MAAGIWFTIGGKTVIDGDQDMPPVETGSK